MFVSFYLFICVAWLSICQCQQGCAASCLLASASEHRSWTRPVFAGKMSVSCAGLPVFILAFQGSVLDLQLALRETVCLCVIRVLQFPRFCPVSMFAHSWIRSRL